MRENTCCFTGHRIVSAEDAEALRGLLDEEIGRLYEDGINCFCCGGALGFDTLAALAVLRARTVHPDIKLLLFLPYPAQAEKWGKADRELYEDILARADGATYSCSGYTPLCMFDRDRRLCDAASVCVAFLEHGSGGTFYTVKYARSNGLKIINLAKRLRGIEDETQ